MMRSSEATQKKETPIYSGLTITNKQRTKVLKYLLADRYYICKYISFDDETTLKQVKNFMIRRERGKAIMFDPSPEQSLYLKIDMPYYESMDILQQQNLPRLIPNFIGKLILATNLNLYSIDNIITNPVSGQVQLNSISIVGILALWKQTEFAFEQFKEIFELLTVDVFDEPTFDRKFPYKLKFRALGMVILKHIFGKDISLLKAIYKQNIPSKITFAEGKQLCKKLPELFGQLLSSQKIRQKITDAQKRDSLSYAAFLQLVFLDPRRQALNWQRVISLFIPVSSKNGSFKNLSQLFIELYKAFNDQIKGGSEISFQRVIRYTIDLYYNNLPNETKQKLYKQGITKESYFYIKQQLPSQSVKNKQSNYQMKELIFNSLIRIMNDDEEKKKPYGVNSQSPTGYEGNNQPRILRRPDQPLHTGSTHSFPIEFSKQICKENLAISSESNGQKIKIEKVKMINKYRKLG